MVIYKGFQYIYERKILVSDMLGKPFNTENFDAKTIAHLLYDPRNNGVMVFPDFVKKGFLYELIGEIEEQRKRYQQAPHVVGSVSQNFKGFWAGEADSETIDGKFPAIMELRKSFQPLYEDIGRASEFQAGPLNSISVNVYDGGPIGITAHRDESKYVNAIAIFCISGDAYFYSCNDRERNGLINFDASPGRLLLMRAPRKKEESELRPFHGVQNVSPGRTSIMLRQVQ